MHFCKSSLNVGNIRENESFIKHIIKSYTSETFEKETRRFHLGGIDTNTIVRSDGLDRQFIAIANQ